MRKRVSLKDKPRERLPGWPKNDVVWDKNGLSPVARARHDTGEPASLIKAVLRMRTVPSLIAQLRPTARLMNSVRISLHVWLFYGICGAAMLIPAGTALADA